MGFKCFSLFSILQATQRSGSQQSRDPAEVKFNGLLKTLHKAESHICNNIKCSFYLYSARVLKRTCFVGCSHVIIIFSAELEQMWCKCSLEVFYGHQNCTIKIRWRRRMNVLGCAILGALKGLLFCFLLHGWANNQLLHWFFCEQKKSFRAL